MDMDRENLRKLAHFMMSRMTQVGSPTIIDGSTAEYKIDSAALTFILAGTVIAGLTLDEAVVTSWDPTNEPFVLIPDGSKARFLFLVNAASTTTAIKARQGPTVLTAATALFPKVPDGYIVIGGADVDDVTGGFLAGATDGTGDWDETTVTLHQIFWPTNGPDAFLLTTVGS